MNDIVICIYYEYASSCHCQLTEQLCINNCEFINAEKVINDTESCDIATNK
jgi:hexokinase